MPRRARLDAPGTLHHVIIRGIEKRSIFRDDADRSNFLLRIGKVSSETTTAVYAWALMNNHAHLLLKSGFSGLPSFMRRLLTGYAVHFNLRHRRNGHLFQNRYKSIVCQEDAYFKELVRYIHLNPLRAGAVENLWHLDRYPWCGHAAIMGNIDYEWQDRNYVLKCFGRHPVEARRRYRSFVHGGIAQGRRPDLVGGGLVRSAGDWSVLKSRRRKGITEKGDERILGDTSFVLAVLEETDRRVKFQFSLSERIDQAKRLVDAECKKRGVHPEGLRAGGRRRAISRLRAGLAPALLGKLGLTQAEAGRILGVSTSAISRILERLNRS